MAFIFWWGKKKKGMITIHWNVPTSKEKTNDKVINSQRKEKEKKVFYKFQNKTEK